MTALFLIMLGVGAAFSLWPLLIALVILYFVDARTVGLWQRFRHARHRTKEMRRLERRLSRQPQDMDARTKLADVLLERRKYDHAIEIVKPVVAGGDHSPATLLLLGRACIGAKKFEAALMLLTEAKEDEPRFRQGVLDLALGELHLASGAYAQAVSALETYCTGSPGSVEGQLLLSKARAGAGDRVGAQSARAQAFANFRVAPVFVRKRDRLLIWRLQPWRPFVLLPLTVFGTFAACIAGSFLVSFGMGQLFTGEMESEPIGKSVALSPAPKPLDLHPSSFDITAEGVTESDLRQVNFVIANVFGQFGRVTPPLFVMGHGQTTGHFEAGQDEDASLALRALEFVSLLEPQLTLTVTIPTISPVTLKQGTWTGDGTPQRLVAQYKPEQAAAREVLVDDSVASFVVVPPDGEGPRIAAALSDRVTEASKEGLLPSVGKVWVGPMDGLVVIEARDGGLSGAFALAAVLRRTVCHPEKCLRAKYLPFSPGRMDGRIREQSHIMKDVEPPISSWLAMEAGFAFQSQMFAATRKPRKETSVEVGSWPEMIPVLRGEQLGWRDTGMTEPRAITMAMRRTVTGWEWQTGTAFLIQPNGTIVGTSSEESLHPLTLRRESDTQMSVVRRGRPDAILIESKDRHVELLGEFEDGVVIEEWEQNLLPPSRDISIAIYDTEGLRFRSEKVRRSMMNVAPSFLWGKDRVVIPSDGAEVAVLSLSERSIKRHRFAPSAGGAYWVRDAGDNRLVALLTPNLMIIPSAPTGARSPMVALDVSTGRTVSHNMERAVGHRPAAIVGDEVWVAHGDDSGVGSFSATTGEWHISATSAALPPTAKIIWATQESGRVVVGTEKDGVRVLRGDTSWLAYQPTEGEQTVASISPTGGVAVVAWTASRSRLILAREDGARAELELPLGPVVPTWVGADAR